MKNYFIFFGLVTSIALTASCSLNDDIDASGVFESTEIIVSSQASGILEMFSVEQGERLRAGERVGLVDTTQLHLQKMLLLSGVKAVGSRLQDVSKQVAATREQIEKQRNEKKRVEKLIAARAATTKQLDDINSAIVVLERQLAAQLSTLQNSNRSIGEEGSGMEIQVAQIEDKLAKSYISSPIDGTVLVKYAERGEMTGVGKPLFKIADTQNMFLRAYITSGQLTQLKLGQEVRVFADFGDKDRREYRGVLSWISDKSEFTPKTIQTRDERANLVYAIKIAVSNDDLLKIGMYADVKF